MPRQPLARAGADQLAELLEFLLVVAPESLVAQALSTDADHGLVDGRIADDADGVLAARDLLHLLFQHLAVQDDAHVAGAKVLARAWRDWPLGHPGQLVLLGDGVGNDGPAVGLIERAGLQRDVTRA